MTWEMRRNSNDGHYVRCCWHDSKMATEPEKAFCVLEFRFLKSVTTVQRGVSAEVS
jgi:hypothetical protein